MNPVDFLTSLGIKADLAQAVVADLGIVTMDDFQFLERDNYVGRGLSAVEIGKIVKTVKGMEATPAAPPAPMVVQVQREPLPLAALTSPHEILDRLATDRKGVMARLAELRVPVVMDVSNDIDAGATRDMWRVYLDNGLSCPGWYENLPVRVPAPDVAKVDLDPFELFAHGRLVALAANRNPESGADWTGITSERRAALGFAARPWLRAQHAPNIANELRAVPTGALLVAMERAAAQPEVVRGYVAQISQRPVSEIGNAAPAAHVEATPASRPVQTTGSAIGQVSSLLKSLFSGDELRRLIRYESSLSRYVDQICWDRSLSEVAFSVAETMQRAGGFTLLLRAVRAERPGCAVEIDALASRIGVVL